MRGIKPVIKDDTHRAIIEQVNQGCNIVSIMENLKVSRSTVQRIKRKHSDMIEIGKPIDMLSVNTGEYSSSLIDSGKYIALKIANTLKYKSMSGASIGQLTASLVNINNLIRLEQGKSTENIAHNVVHNLNDEQLKLIKDSIMNLKKSMLS